VALDTAKARSSAIFTASPWRCQLPQPDNTIDAQDRALVAYFYILASGSSASGGDFIEFVIPFRRRRR